MDFRILGPLECWDGPRAVPIPQGRPSALLAYLLLHANEVVTSDRLVEELWDGEPPRTAAKAVQNHVSQLRKLLNGGEPGAPSGSGTLITQGRGYVLRIDREELDANRFAALVDEGRAAFAGGDAQRADRLLREALAMWRGPPLADFTYDAFAAAEIVRLDEARLEAVEERIDVELALGMHYELVPELEQLAREHPLRESLQGQLMLALYRAGRQADALDVYRNARQTLLDELGLEPGPALRELERAILEQDPAIDAPPAAPLQRLARRRRGAAAVAVGGLVLLAAAGVGAFAVMRGGDQTGLASAAPNTVALVDPRSRTIRGQVPIPDRPVFAAPAAGSMWIGSDARRTITAIDERTHEVKHVVIVEAIPGDLASGPSGVWLVDRWGRKLVQIDPRYGEVVRTVLLPAAKTSPVRDTPGRPRVAVGANAVWVTDGSSRLLKIAPASGKLVKSIDLGVSLDDVAVDSAAVWAASGPSATVVAVDPDSGAVRARIPIVVDPDAASPFPTSVASGEGFVWTLNANTASVTKIDPVTRSVAETIPLGVGSSPSSLAVGAGAVWLANRGDGMLVRIDAASGDVSTTRIGPSVPDVAVGRDSVWATVVSGFNTPRAATVPPASAAQALPESLCSPVQFPGAGTPDVLLASDMPLQGFAAEYTSQISAAIGFALERRGHRAGRWSVGYQSCDHSKPGSGLASDAKCAANARAFVQQKRVLGVIGPLYSSCAQVEVPIGNAAPGGPLAFVGFSTTYTGLTRVVPGVQTTEPDRYYPSGRRNFVRVIASDDYQAAANAVLAGQLGARSVYVLADDSDYSHGLAAAFRPAAAHAGIDVAGEAMWQAHADRYTRLAERVAASGADAVLLTGVVEPGSSLLADLRQALPPGTPLLGTDSLLTVFKQPERYGRALEGLTVSVPGLPPERLEGAGRDFVASFSKRIGTSPEPYSLYAAQAADVLLDAIARSNGTRSSVTANLLSTKLANGLLGNVSFTPSGDMTSAAVLIYQVRGGKRVIRDVIYPPQRLLATAR